MLTSPIMTPVMGRITSAASLGGQTISPALLTNSQQFFAPTVTVDETQVVSPSLLTNSNTLYAPAIRKILKPALLTDGDTLFAPTVSVISPKAYGSDLKFYFDARFGVTQSGTVTAWVDQDNASKTLVVPGADTAPTYVASALNGRPAVEFDSADDRLELDDAVYDALWAGAGVKRLSFVCKINDLTTGTTTMHIIEKSRFGSGRGWTFQIDVTNAQIQFDHKAANNSVFTVELGAEIAEGNILAGSVEWDGDVTSSANVNLRLYSNSGGTFTDRSPTVVTQTGQTLGDDGLRGLTVGNTNNGTGFDQQFGGTDDGNQIMALWFTNPAPADFTLDDAIMDGWIP